MLVTPIEESNSIAQRVNVGPTMMVDSMLSANVIPEAGLDNEGDVKAIVSCVVG